MNIILASASPRRKQILENAGINFDIHVSEYNESFESLKFSQEKIENAAFNKAKDVAKKFQENLIIGADTVVVLDDIIFLKPKNIEDAKIMLKKLSDRTHFVQTSICMICGKKSLIKSTKTFVTFNNLSDELINNYVEKYNPLDKAGAYGIQELPEGFLKRIEGDLENVIGISSKVAKEMLNFFTV